MKKNLVLVHGYLGGSSQWAKQVSLFSTYFNLITIDLPGFGLNYAMESPQTIRGYAEFVFNHLDKQGIEKFHLLGHSMGGMIVQEMAAIAPSKIEKLILYGTGPVGMLPNRFETIEESKRRISKDGPIATGCRIAATWFMQGDQAGQYHICARLAEKASHQAALAGLDAMASWSGEAYLTHIKLPTLVIWGDGDRTYQWPQPEQLWRNITAAKLGVVPGCAHAAHLEKPHLFNALVMDFLKP
ncbi:alpha/beta hydrolase [Oceanospirillaceae bacterium]|jgi:pimeloyl-ACP methyl ester carboxylesterase|nr:alpha/beta hydrolase [Oceanospirillaceae bacterium]MDC1341018.1 alpha/beta hydrolase [Oceanospirillaceae bacterium]|tara:strand:- start:967 stop:1692 length:726 start_codon:yes stop_codon:yes gene_type:complete